MPTWEAIEDSSSSPTRIWLCREKEEDEWKPLRKSDCRALNSKPGEEVLIEGGRATADPANGNIRYNFYNSPKLQLTSATWFVREERSGKDSILLPMSMVDADAVEVLYQRAVAATSSLGDGINTLLKEEVTLQDDKYRVMVAKTGSGVLTMKKKPKGWFGTTYDLQRGYGEYTIEGEDDEMALGPVRQLIFVIHGIGEALWSRQDVGVPSIIDEMNRTRAAIQRKQVTEWRKDCDKAKKAGQPEPPAPNRIELLPIEWYDRIHSSSSSLMKSLKATTLQSIPALRAIANDVVFDVLMYLTPTFCESVLECVIGQIDDLFHGFQTVHPEFSSSGGKCSLIGHSLGSVIVWDMLSLLKEVSEPKRKDPENDDGPIIPFSLCGVSIPSVDSVTVGYQAYATKDKDANIAENGTWGPSLPKGMKRTLPFEPEFTVFLGSPIGLFLTLRGAHAVFDEMRLAAVREAQQGAKNMSEKGGADEKDSDPLTYPSASPFKLPSGAIYNIFHPSDPVAYRIEPLLLPQDTNDAQLPPPLYLVKPGQGVRLHVMAMQISDGIRRSLVEKKTSWSSLITQVTEQYAPSLTTIADADEANKKNVKGITALRPGPLKFALGGKSDRVDFQLQPGVIDNEYFSAVTAHSSYFFNNDFLDFLVEIALPKTSAGDSPLVSGTSETQASGTE